MAALQKECGGGKISLRKRGERGVTSQKETTWDYLSRRLEGGGEEREVEGGENISSLSLTRT